MSKTTDLYTDDAVAAVAGVLHDFEVNDGVIEVASSLILRAVAPAIAARALREAARAYRSARDERATITYLQCESFLLARANEIEIADGLH